MPKETKIGHTRQLAAKLIYSTLEILNKSGGELSFAEIKEKLEKKVELNDWDKSVTAKGSVRWVVFLSFYSINCVKAGLIVKDKGIWYITDEGKSIIKQKNELELLFFIEKEYREWNAAQKTMDKDGVITEEVPDSVVISFEEIKNQSYEDLMKFIHSRTAFEFQDMAAALLRAMGYYTPFVAPKGKDGGIDIIGYSDPLGAKQPILKVQVKHYGLNNPVPVDVIHNIIGVSKGDMPIVITSGRFTDAAKKVARESNVRLIDGTEFFGLWIQYYDKMREEDKNRMPIEPVYFIKRAE